MRCWNKELNRRKPVTRKMLIKKIRSPLRLIRPGIVATVRDPPSRTDPFTASRIAPEWDSAPFSSQKPSIYSIWFQQFPFSSAWK
nr:hypothetical protein Itr_chr03CG10560 [Ipomoea trifida]GLL21988.1 hypothetical protein Itr_chr03CG10570 [Ipomoea trifida]